jgi:hypothetical protein
MDIACPERTDRFSVSQDEHSIKDIMKTQGLGRELLSARARVEGGRTGSLTLLSDGALA